MNSKKPKNAAAKIGRAVYGGAARGYSRLNGYLARHRPLKILISFVVLFIMFWSVCWQNLDLDFGWHLVSGNYIRAHGIPAHDIFTYTARSYRWVDHEWGNDVIVSFLYGLGGYGLLTALFAGLWSAALLIASGFRGRLLTLIIAALAVAPYAGIRPVTWTALLFALALAILRGPKRRLRWCLPFMFVAWANLHAGFVAGLALVAYFAIKERKRPVFYLLVLCVLATLINAYGLRLYGEVAHTLFDPALHSEIGEWASLTILPASWLFVILWLAAFFWEFDYRQWKRWFGLSPLLLAATLSATRNMPLFVIASLKELDETISRVIQALPKRLDRPRKIVVGLYLCLCGLLIVLIYTFYISSTWPWSQNREAIFPEQAVAYLQVHRCQGNLFNSYNYGGYLIWKLPSQPVYIDGRMPTWRVYMDNYENVIHDPATYYRQQFSRYNIRCALLENGPTTVNLAQLLQKAHWRTVIRANGSILLLAPNPN